MLNQKNSKDWVDKLNKLITDQKKVFEQTEPDFLKVVEIDTTDQEAWYHLGYIQYQLEKNKEAKVEVAPDQLSLAIGRGGQNVRLASKLTGWKIDVLRPEGMEVPGTATEGGAEAAAEAVPAEEAPKKEEGGETAAKSTAVAEEAAKEEAPKEEPKVE